jgi:hypothetical protein
MLPGMDLYERLVELQGMTRLLIDDVELLKPKIGELKPDISDEEKANRRFYVRAVFALVEAFVEQHRRLLLELCAANRIQLNEKSQRQLRQVKEVFMEDGTTVEHEQYLKIFDKIKAVYKAAVEGFGEPLKVTFGDSGWITFKDAMQVRNGITHPKRAEDCWIHDGALASVNEANAWFKLLQNEFVRVARKHRAANGW